MRSLAIYFRVLKLRFGFTKRFLEKNAIFFDYQRRVKGEADKKLKLRQAWYEYMFEKDCIEYDIRCLGGINNEVLNPVSN